MPPMRSAAGGPGRARSVSLGLLIAGLFTGCAKHETTPMPNDGWARALSIAEQTHAYGLAKWTDDLPYLFQAKMTRGVLVHHGAVVSARGPAAAGAYLRDIGILQGKGPSPRSLLTLLYVLHAFPVVPGLAEQSAVDTLGPEDLRPRVELSADGHAHVILNYSLPDDDPGPDRGTAPVMRETLDIGPTGDAAWSATPFVWTRPH